MSGLLWGWFLSIYICFFKWTLQFSFFVILCDFFFGWILDIWILDYLPPWNFRWFFFFFFWLLKAVTILLFSDFSQIILAKTLFLIVWSLKSLFFSLCSATVLRDFFKLQKLKHKTNNKRKPSPQVCR